MEDAPLTRQAKLEKGVSEGKLAQIYEELGLNKMAQSYYESALKTCAQVAKAEGLTTLGQRATQAIWRLYFQKGEPEKAIQACEAIVAEFPDSELVPKAYLTMGEALMQQAEDVKGEGEEAEKERSGYARRAIPALQKLQKTNADKDSKAKALFNIGKALYMTGQDGSQELEKVVKKYPDTIYAPKALALSGRNAYKSGDFASAHEYFTRVVMTYPNAEDIAEVMFLRANSLVKQGKYSDAMSAYTELLENYPGSTYAKKAKKIKSAIRRKLGG
jgi:TolA-binding protein